MDAATWKQKAFMKKLLVRFGVPNAEFNEPEQLKIGKEEAHCIITELLLLKKCGWGDLRGILSDGLEGKQVLKYVTKTFEELEEEPDYPPDDWEMEVPEERARQYLQESTGEISGRVFRKNTTLIFSCSQIYLTKSFLLFFSFSGG
jgi:hypothetical protein